MAEQGRPEITQEAADKLIGQLLRDHKEARDRIVTNATWVIRILQGNDPDTRLSGGNDRDDEAFREAPAAIPQVTWKAHLPGMAEAGHDDVISVFGSLGGRFVERRSDERPSTVFNAAFFAGVVAVRLGLVNPDDFLLAGEEPQADTE